MAHRDLLAYDLLIRAPLRVCMCAESKRVDEELFDRLVMQVVPPLQVLGVTPLVPSSEQAYKGVGRLAQRASDRENICLHKG